VVGVSPVIAMWAHSRSASTAFLRMMIERGDVTVVHEPLLALTQEGRVVLPKPDGGTLEARSEPELLACLAELSATRPVFVKEVVDYRYAYLFDHPDEIAWMTHTFLVRDPRQAISSHYAVKPTVTCPEIGYERLHELFELTWSVTGRKPLVIRAERLLGEPAAVVEEYCSAVGLPFLPQALSWEPGDRPEWRRHRGWHLDTISSAGFSAGQKVYAVTVDNNAVLKSFYDHHYPFYRRIVQHAI
jgi:Sulfotransferase domain